MTNLKNTNNKDLRIVLSFIFLITVINYYRKKSQNIKCPSASCLYGDKKSIIIEINLKFGKAGLSNKILMFCSACDIAIKNKVKLLEPTFGWNKKILFSDIYDLDYFNNHMKKYNNGENIIVPYNKKDGYLVKKFNYNLWTNSEETLNYQRNIRVMKSSCMNIVVLRNLRLNKVNQKLLNNFKNISKRNAVHFRLENDWVNYMMNGKKFNEENGEGSLYSIEDLVKLYSKKWENEDIFFTTGDNHELISLKLKENNIDSKYMFDPDLEYEINAAINFELCCRAKTFTGQSRSTFTSLISLKRSLTNKNNSFIYNYKNNIILRSDLGLYTNPYEAINKVVTIK